MSIENKKKHLWRYLALLSGGIAISPTAQAQTSQPNNAEKMPKIYFSPKQLAYSLKEAKVDDEKTVSFIEAYVEHIDPNGKITPQGLVDVFKKADFTKSESQTVTSLLLAEEEQSHVNGYNRQGYEFIFAIDETGNLNYLHMNGTKRLYKQDIDEVHNARCRHLGLAVDNNKNRFYSSQFIVGMMIRDIILERQKTNNKVANGEKFLQKFEEKLAKNGLTIGKDGKLHGVETSKNKPLLTTEDIYRQYLLKRKMEFDEFSH